MSRATLYCGDVREVLAGLLAESVQCVVTSPPYWGLRDYGTGKWSGGDDGCKHRVGGQVQDTKWTGAITTGQRPGVDASLCIDCGATKIDAQLGLERTPEEYVANMVAVFREVRRVLRPDGVCWLNLGDSYNSIGGTIGGGKNVEERKATLRGWQSGLKPKDLVGIPWRVAFALQQDGWWLRSDVIWAKPNPMPESVTDRPTRSHEYLFLLTKSATYWYDAQAIAEESSDNSHGVLRGDPGAKARYTGNRSGPLGLVPVSGTRNARSVWTIATTPFPGAHFACFPEELARRCILAGSSPRACEQCGAPWERTQQRFDTGQRQKMADGWATHDGGHGSFHRNGRERGEAGVPVMGTRTTGWQPTCSCESAGTGRCVVLDCFGGSGTVAQVATGNGRDSIYIDLNPKYLELARQRIGPMFCGEVA